ncbi:hypothetical protein [Candidatus Poriferisodalis sp.]|uniref:hypothetical protein n=1 Tax=Candidatus Poriferisodalis sp. TaxID=3101277 RepID=UPI003B01F69E
MPTVVKRESGMVTDAVLARLEARFVKRRRRLLKTDAGRWALVVDRTRQSDIEVFDSERDALAAGAQHPSRRRFCVEQIVETREVVHAALGPREVGAVMPASGRSRETRRSGGSR